MVFQCNTHITFGTFYSVKIIKYGQKLAFKYVMMDYSILALRQNLKQVSIQQQKLKFTKVCM